MSWIFGYYGKGIGLRINPPEIPLYSFRESSLILYAGGNNDTVFSKSESSNTSWVVAGVGLLHSGEEYKILNIGSWDNFLGPRQINLNKINGHFVAIKYSDDELKFFTDELGLREIYIVQLPDGFGFTTRIDWLKYFINPELDLKEFGSRWLLQNQISRKSIIKNVIRLVRANATIKNNSLSIEQNLWQPDFESIANKEIFDSILKNILSIKDKKISLSLSGGLDSRLLLSYLSKKDFDIWDTHSFGDPNHPDSNIASALLISLNRKNEIVNDQLPSNDKLVELVKIYSGQSIVTNPASSILNLRFYDRLSNRDRVIIDGGFGEIWRGSFAKKLLYFGRNALMKKESKSVSGFLRYKRADIFSEEALIEMERGTIEQFDILFEEMPDIKQISPKSWIELFSIRTRLTNYYSPEQARVDQFVISFMPLVQRDVLTLLFGIPDAVKKNGKMLKQLIKQNANVFTTQPLVKGNIIHPFNSSSLGARIHSRIKNKLGLSYQSKQPIEFQNLLREFIGDVIKSSEVRNYKYYNRKKLGRIADDFLSKENNFNSEVDWFLSFELFRQGISK